MYQPDREYIELWRYILGTLLNGFWIRFFAAFSVATGMWLMVVRRNIIGGFIFFIVSLVLTYLPGVINLFK